MKGWKTFSRLSFGVGCYSKLDFYLSFSPFILLNCSKVLLHTKLPSEYLQCPSVDAQENLISSLRGNIIKDCNLSFHVETFFKPEVCRGELQWELTLKRMDKSVKICWIETITFHFISFKAFIAVSLSCTCYYRQI